MVPRRLGACPSSVSFVPVQVQAWQQFRLGISACPRSGPARRPRAQLVQECPLRCLQGRIAFLPTRGPRATAPEPVRLAARCLSNSAAHLDSKSTVTRLRDLKRGDSRPQLSTNVCSTIAGRPERLSGFQPDAVRPARLSNSCPADVPVQLLTSPTPAHCHTQLPAPVQLLSNSCLPSQHACPTPACQLLRPVARSNAPGVHGPTISALAAPHPMLQRASPRTSGTHPRPVPSVAASFSRRALSTRPATDRRAPAPAGDVRVLAATSERTQSASRQHIGHRTHSHSSQRCGR